MIKFKKILPILTLAALGTIPPIVRADNAQTNVFTLVIANHQFTPAVITIPANQRCVLIIRNNDPTPAEFESNELNREKIIAGNSQVKIFIGPLPAGNYPFYEEFHSNTTRGRIQVR